MKQRKNRRCLGITRKGRRCRIRGDWWLFCGFHWPWFVKIALTTGLLGTLSVLGSIASIFSLFDPGESQEIQEIHVILKRQLIAIEGLQRARETDQLEWALSGVKRTYQQAEGGDALAAQAIKEARKGDTSSLLRVLEKREGTLANAQNELVSLYREIAAIAYLKGELNTAEESLQKVLNHIPYDLHANNQLGHIAKVRSNYSQAEEYYLRVLSDAENDRAWKAAAYGNLGIVYRRKGQLGQAEELHKRSLEIDEELRNLGGIASDYSNLGAIYLTQGKLNDAEKMFRKALKLDEKLKNHGGIAIDSSNLGLVYLQRGQLDQAEKMLNRSLVIEQELGRIEGIANDCSNLGLIYLRRNKLDEAEEMLKKTLRTEKVLENKEGMAGTYSNLGTLYGMRGKFEMARESFAESHKLYLELDMPAMAARIQMVQSLSLFKGWLDGLDTKSEKANTTKGLHNVPDSK